MSKFPIDLSKFKKIQSEDQNITVLQSKDGHTVKLAHKALSPKMRGMLAELKIHMAEGGEVAIKKENYKEDKKQDAKIIQYFPNGGEVQENPPVIVNVGAQQPMPVAAPMPLPVQASVPEQVPQMSPDMQAAAAAATPTFAEPMGATGSTGPIGIIDSDSQVPSAQAVAALQQDNQVAQAESGRGLATLPKTVDQNQSDPYGANLSSSLYMEGLDRQKKGILGEAVAQGEAMKAQAAAIRQGRIAQEQVLKDYKQHINSLNDERQQFLHDYEQKHIDPKRIFANMSTGNKISTAIGLMLGGLSAAAGQENAGLAMLNRQIDRDIDAQKAEMDKGKNLMAFNMEHFKNIHEATEMTRLQLNDIAAKRLQEGIAKMQDPVLKSKAMQQLGALEQQSSQTAGQMAARKAMLSAPSGVVSADKKVEFGLQGEAQKQAREELKDAQLMTNIKDRVLEAFDKYSKVNTLGNKVFSPFQTKAIKDSIEAAIIPMLSKDTAGRYTIADAEELKKLLPSLMTNKKTVQEIRSEMVKLLNAKYAFPTLKAYNIGVEDLGRHDLNGQRRIQQFEPNLK